MSNAFSSIAANISLYYSLTFKRRKMIQRMFYGDKREISIVQIANWAKSSTRAVSDFIHFLQNDPVFNKIIDIKKRFNNKSKLQQTNLFVLDKGFLEAIDWMRRFGYLNCSVRKRARILKHAHFFEKIDENCYAEMTKTSTPLKDTLRDFNKERKKDTLNRNFVSKNTILDGLGLDETAIFFAQRHLSEYQQVEARGAFLWQIKRNRVYNRSAYFIGTAKNIKRGIHL